MGAGLIFARGRGVVVDHCVFYGCRITVVYWSETPRNGRSPARTGETGRRGSAGGDFRGSDGWSKGVKRAIMER
jgi:hypothetical protein